MPQCLKHVYPMYKHVKLVRMVWFWQSAIAQFKTSTFCSTSTKNSINVCTFLVEVPILEKAVQK